MLTVLSVRCNRNESMAASATLRITRTHSTHNIFTVLRVGDGCWWFSCAQLVGSVHEHKRSIFKCRTIIWTYIFITEIIYIAFEMIQWSGAHQLVVHSSCTHIQWTEHTRECCWIHALNWLALDVHVFASEGQWCRRRRHHRHLQHPLKIVNI